MPNSPRKAPERDPAFPHNMMRDDYLGPAENASKGAAGTRQAHDQMQRNFANERNKSDVQGLNTTPSRKK